MKLPVIAAAAALGLCAPALAQSNAIWEPCFTPEGSAAAVAAAFEADGWTISKSPEARLDGLQTAAEPLFALQNLPDVSTGSSYDRHIVVAHEQAERLLANASVFQRDNLVAVVESYEKDVGSMIRCTIAGPELDEVAKALDARSDDIRDYNGNEILLTPVDDVGIHADVTLYRLLAPADATAEGRAPLAAIAIVHLP